MQRAIGAWMLALQYFTRVPLPGPLARWAGFDAGLQRASLAHFPGIGLLVSAVATGVYAAASRFLPHAALAPLVAATLSTAATILLTGALHEDGLADTADGLGGSAQRERALEIMKDSRVGTFGALALVLVVLTKVGVLALIGAAAGWRAVAASLVGAHVLSRGLTLVLVRRLPYVGDTQQSKSVAVAAQIEWSALAIAAAWCALGLALAVEAGSRGMVAAGSIAALIALAWIVRLFARRLQGYTGDCLGAAQQVCELAFYFGAAIALADG